MANDPQQTVRELKDLVIAYAKQETADPLKGLKRFVAFGLAGALLMGIGVSFLAVGVLRLLESNRGWLVHGNWSWIPYAVVVVALFAIAGLAWTARSRGRRAKRGR